jgi:chemotaxis protein MotB
LLPEEPNSPRNRRITIVLLRDPQAQADKPGNAAAAANAPAAPASTPAPAPASQFKRDWTGPRVQ